MPYLTSVERIGMEKGMQQEFSERNIVSCIKDDVDEAERELEKYILRVRNTNLIYGVKTGWIEMGREMLIDALDERFGKVPESVSNKINQLYNQYSLRTLLRYVFRSKSIEEFQQVLNDF